VEATGQAADDQQIAAALVDRAAEVAPSQAAQTSIATGDAVSLPTAEDFVPLPIRRPGDRTGDKALALAQRQLQMASLASPQRGRRVASLSTVGSTARKGDRPTAIVAAEQPQRNSIRTEPKLTDTIISKWALAQNRVKTMSTPPGQARKFVGSQLREAPKTVYANAFAPGGDLPHNQFSGSAVNFINVARFGD
jgi:hypothetical protein